jgi:hypothetical protein
MADREATSGDAIELDGVTNPSQLIFNSVVAPATDYVLGQTSKKGTIWQQKGWQMAAKVDTLDQPAPKETGQSVWTLPDQPGFASQQNQSTVQSGQLYTITKSGVLQAVRIYVPQVQDDVTYSLIVFNETDPANIEAEVIALPQLQQNQWTTVVSGTSYIKSGAKLRFALDSLNSNSGTSFQGGWTKGSNSTSAPASQGWNKNSQNTIVRVDKTDLDSTDRSSELNSVIPNSIIKFSQTSDLTKFEEYFVISTTNFTTYVEYSVSVQNIANGGVNVGETTTCDFDIPVPQFTQYSEISAYWASNTVPFADVEGFVWFDNVPQASKEDNAYGVDVKFQALEISPDWNFLSFTNSIIGATSGDTVGIELRNLGRFYTESLNLAFTTNDFDLNPAIKFTQSFSVTDGTYEIDLGFEIMSMSTNRRAVVGLYLSDGVTETLLDDVLEFEAKDLNNNHWINKRIRQTFTAGNYQLILKYGRRGGFSIVGIQNARLTVEQL